MRGWRSRLFRSIGVIMTSLGIVLIILGALLGWVAPGLSSNPPHNGIITSLAPILKASAAQPSDLTSFLGADITALAVIIAILIGYNIAALQIAGQTVSVALTRAMLFTLGPFLLGWIGTTAVALLYVVAPPPYVGQIWQVVLWFGAVTLLTVGYLWNLPWRLSGEYAAQWSIRSMRASPMSEWELTDGFAVLQSGLAAATQRADIVTVRTMSTALGRFLSGVCDPSAEQHPHFVRERYWALRNLVTGCVQHAEDAPSAIPYSLGFVLGGALLQAAAVGLAMDDVRIALFAGVLQTLREAPASMTAIWSGIVYSLCRTSPVQGDAYLRQYWRSHRGWRDDDMQRRVTQIAAAMARLHIEIWKALQQALPTDAASTEGAVLLIELYRYIGEYLGPTLATTHRPRRGLWLGKLPRELLTAVEDASKKQWPIGEDASRREVHAAYETYCKRLLELETRGSVGNQTETPYHA